MEDELERDLQRAAAIFQQIGPHLERIEFLQAMQEAGKVLTDTEREELYMISERVLPFTEELAELSRRINRSTGH